MRVGVHSIELDGDAAFETNSGTAFFNNFVDSHQFLLDFGDVEH